MRLKTNGITEHIRRVFRRAFVLSPKVLIVTSGILLVVIALQLMYPRNRTLPFARLDGQRIGSKTEAQISQRLIDTYSRVPLTLEIKGEVKSDTNTVPLAKAGASPDVEKVLHGLKDYPSLQRVVPFSLLMKGLLKNQAVELQLDPKNFSEYASARLAACAVEPTNASVVIKDGTAALSPAKNGQSCNKQKLQKTVEAQHALRHGMKVFLEADVIRPARSDKDVSALLKNAEELVGRIVALKLAETEYPVERTTLASWLSIQEDPQDKKKMSLDVDTQKVRAYVSDMQKKIYIEPTPTVIRTVDGIESGRTEGVTGRGLNHTTTADALKKQLLEGNGTVVGTLIALTPKIVYERSYSASRAGLQALLNDIVKDKGDYGISVRMLDGSVVSANGSKRYHPASTYKMYVAYSLLKRIENGSLKWEDTATAGKNISQCFDVMIVNSDNTCAEWLGDKIGWSNINTEVKALGLSSTSTIRGGMYTTADDESLFLLKVQNGSALAQPERDRLLDVMKRQIYRAGIPTGVRVTVADKVGFLDGKLHDAAIVYGSKTYMLTIMSQGSSWAQIADAARQIHEQLNRM